MTYCVGVLVEEGLVMVADTRTNAGLDDISTYRKLHMFTKPGERVLALASAGNLSVTQSVLSLLTEGVGKMEQIYAGMQDVGVKDRSLIWNTDMVETLELDNLMAQASVTIKAAENRADEPCDPPVNSDS